MNDAPLVSVVIIFLDEERFLAEAVESVLGQSCNSWQLLLVDDGSTDGSTRIARGYAAAHPGRIEYLEHPCHRRLGTGPSRQLGLEHSRGRYLAYLDGDDVWLPGKLAAQVGLMDAHPRLAMTYGRTQVWYGWQGTGGVSRDYLKPLGVSPGQEIQPPHLLTVLLADEFACPGCGSVLLRRQPVCDVGGFDEAFPGQYEDMVLYAKLLLRYPAFVEDATYSRYRQHEGNSWIDDRRRARWYPEWLTPSRGRYLKWVADHLDRHPDRVTPELAAALDQALRPYRQPLRYAADRGWRLGRYYLRQAARSLTGRSDAARER
jgi:glycosyltransferase involved in cell wall biosynthesis